MKQRNYLALIGDVVGSKTIRDRAALQDQLQQALLELNRKFSGSVASRFVLTIGDEFQGLLRSADQTYRLLSSLRVAIHPIEVRIGLGTGQLTTALREEALGMDGPCFHRAREAIQRATRRGTQLEVVSHRDRASFDLFALLAGAIRDDLTARQRLVLDFFMTGLEGKEIAAKLSISPSAVSQHLKASKAAVLREATQRWLQELVRELQTEEARGQ